MNGRIGSTYTTPPDRYPDTQFGTGWQYLFVGLVDLEMGEIKAGTDEVKS